MIRYLILAFALLCGGAQSQTPIFPGPGMPASAGGTVTLGVSGNSTGAVGLTNTVVLTGTTAGCGLVVGNLWNGSGVTLSSVAITGESNATIHASTLAVLSGGAGFSAQFASLANNTGGGTKTVTMTISGSASLRLFAVELCNQSTSAFFNAGNGSNNAASANGSTSVTTVSPGNCAMLGININNGAAQATAGTALAYTRVTLGNFVAHEVYEYILSTGSTGATTVDFTHASAGWVVSGACFNHA